MNSKKILSMLMVGATVTSLMAGSVSAYAADNTETTEAASSETTEPLTIAEQGIFSAGGLLQTVHLIRKISGKKPVPVRPLMQIMQMFYTRFQKKKPVCQWYSCMDMDSHVWVG